MIHYLTGPVASGKTTKARVLLVETGARRTYCPSTCHELGRKLKKLSDAIVEKKACKKTAWTKPFYDSVLLEDVREVDDKAICWFVNSHGNDLIAIVITSSVQIPGVLKITGVTHHRLRRPSVRECASLLVKEGLCANMAAAEYIARATSCDMRQARLMSTDAGAFSASDRPPITAMEFAMKNFGGPAMGALTSYEGLIGDPEVVVHDRYTHCAPRLTRVMAVSEYLSLGDASFPSGPMEYRHIFTAVIPCVCVGGKFSRKT